MTYLLQYSLGGNSKTLMFVMVSPLEANVKETLTSLKFATKVWLFLGFKICFTQSLIGHRFIIPTLAQPRNQPEFEAANHDICCDLIIDCGRLMQDFEVSNRTMEQEALENCRFPCMKDGWPVICISPSFGVFPGDRLLRIPT